MSEGWRGRRGEASKRAAALVYRGDTCRTIASATSNANGNTTAREVAPVRVAPDDLEPDTLRAVFESFVLGEGTDDGLQETSLEDKVAQVLAQLRRGEAHTTFDPATGSVNMLTTSAIGRPGRLNREGWPVIRHSFNASGSPAAGAGAEAHQWIDRSEGRDDVAHSRAHDNDPARLGRV